ncbi:ubiquinone/menaquinone biosynthesis methyltransferase [Nocardia otitidiscaviarum]|uniref:Ubiquinone/menaquinone biosynthesis methyltransferase n=1 Tax=Nocardia otitidiscaviarum TaxID=1823 RepID=A0A379JNA9_9NOCA|nr:class I SAM-dependent methyltransferase [Nocardia otitidiscaviarum]SUD49503.1 ubiquinone/menaquinone biosynthesis methyltransferase [Nocardia otitidiscaviarum]
MLRPARPVHRHRAHYAAHRPGYPPQLFTYLTQRLGLDGTQQVLDLGCGTGQIAVHLAPTVAHVHAVDPDPDMLAEGAARATGIDNISWRDGDSYRVTTLDLPTLDLVTMGSSFHWTDREALLTALDQLVAPTGAVVIVGSGRPGTTPPPPWHDIVTRIRTSYLGAERRAGSGTYTHPDRDHVDVLADSAFSQIETRSWTWSTRRTIDSIVGLQLSYSYSAPRHFGSADLYTAYEADLRAALVAAFGADAVLTEPLHTDLILATRPDGARP